MDPVTANPIVVANDAAARRKGILLALLAIPAGVVLWVVIWMLGYIASVSAFVIAAGAVWLYTVGAKQRPTGNAVWAIVGIIFVGVVLSFLGGMTIDVLKVAAEQSGRSWGELLGMSEFWQMFQTVFSSSDVWSAYAQDIAMAVGFAALGTFSIIKDLIVARKSAA